MSKSDLFSFENVGEEFFHEEKGDRIFIERVGVNEENVLNFFVLH